MCPKILLVAICTLLAQIASGVQHEKGIVSWLKIDGDTYLVHAFGGYTREEARRDCKELNMKLVTFKYEEKWNAVAKFMADNFYDSQNFWMGAINDEDEYSDNWYWEDSGASVKQFYWRPNEPDIHHTSSKTCMAFQPLHGEPGWGDFDCDLKLDYLCQCD